jgi:RNA polymerase sigma-70 factor (ECF subfamily)
VLPERSQQATLRSLGDDGLRGLVERYVDAWESRNVEAMVSLLVEDATFAMPPHPHWFSGRETVVAFISQYRPTLRHVVTSAGGQPAIAWYILDAERGAYLPASIEVLTMEGERVKWIVAFADLELFPRFGLPASLRAAPAQLV